MLLTSTQSNGRCWFPTVPRAALLQSAKYKKGGGRCTWKLQFTVPRGMTAVGSGALWRRVPHVDANGKSVESFFFKCKENLSAIPPNRICLFVGYFSCISGNAGPDGMSQGRDAEDEEIDKDIPTPAPGADSDSDPDGQENTKLEEDGGAGAKHKKRKVDKQKDAKHSATKDGGGGTATGSGVPLITLITLKGFESLLPSAVSSIVGGIRALKETFGTPYPHPQLAALFLPIGTSELGVGTGVWDPGTTLFDAIPNPTNCTSFVYGSTVVFDSSVLHTDKANHAGIMKDKEIVAEGVISILFGGVFDVSPLDASTDAWILLAFRRLAVESFIKESLGLAHLTAMNWLRIELFARLVEGGHDVSPLSAYAGVYENDFDVVPRVELPLGQIDSNWYSPHSVIFGLKSSFIFPSLEVLLSSPRGPPTRAGANEFDASASRWSLPPGTLVSFCAMTVARAIQRGPGELTTTLRFLEKFQRRVKAIFISSGTWRGIYSTTAGSGATHFTAPAPMPQVPPSVDTLDVNLYASAPSINIGRLLEDIAGFSTSWIFGCGCSAVSIGMFLQLQKKTAIPTLESLTLCYDESPLQPPIPLEPYSGMTESAACSASSVPALKLLLEEAGCLDPEGEVTAMKDDLTDAYHRLANHDSSSLLAEYSIDLPFANSTSYELLIKDNGLGLGFGYVGKEASLLGAGDGSLHSVLQTRLNGDWGALDTDQRATLTADIAARIAVIHSKPHAKNLPVCTPAPYPAWLLSCLITSILRDLTKYPSHLGRLRAVRSSSMPDLLFLMSHLTGEDLGYDEPSGTSAEIRSPLSSGFGKYFSDLVAVHVCTEGSVLQHLRFLQLPELPLTIDMRLADSADLLAKTTGEKDRWTGMRRPARRFCGTLSSADEPLLIQEGPEVGKKSNEGIGRPAKKEKVKYLPVLWLRILAETRPIWLARVHRCQSVGMWEHQLVNDNFLNSKLEAVKALGQIPSVLPVISRLALTLRDHRTHPLLRSFAAGSLRELHNNPSSFHAADCSAVLMNYLYTYHYKQKLATVGIVPLSNSRLSESGDEDAEMNQETIVVPKVPPFWLTSEMIFLYDLMSAISKLKGADGRTPVDVLDVLAQPLTHQQSEVSEGEAVNADYYVAHLIRLLGHVRLASTHPRHSVEILTTPTLLRSVLQYSMQAKGRESESSTGRAPNITPKPSQAIENLQKTIEREWTGWRESIDPDLEAMFLNVWRVYRLDCCLHSHQHIVTCMCLRVFSRCGVYRELARLKYCEDNESDFQLLAFLPLNFMPLLMALIPWLKGVGVEGKIKEKPIEHAKRRHGNYGDVSMASERENVKGGYGNGRQGVDDSNETQNGSRRMLENVGDRDDQLRNEAKDEAKDGGRDGGRTTAGRATASFQACGASVARAQVSVCQQIGQHLKRWRLIAQGLLEDAAFPTEREAALNLMKDVTIRDNFYKLIGSGVQNLTQQMLTHYLTYSDRHVELAALKALFVNLINGSLEPPLLFLNRRPNVALQDFQNVSQLGEYFKSTLESTRPAIGQLGNVWYTFQSLLTPILEAMNSADSNDVDMDNRERNREKREFGGRELGRSLLTPVSIDPALKYIASSLFCCRWTAADESKALQVSGSGVLNAVIVATRLEELLTTSDSTPLLLAVWDVLSEVLADAVKETPMALMPFWLKQYRFQRTAEPETPDSSTLDAETNDENNNLMRSRLPPLFDASQVAVPVVSAEKTERVTSNNYPTPTEPFGESMDHEYSNLTTPDPAFMEDPLVCMSPNDQQLGDFLDFGEDDDFADASQLLLDDGDIDFGESEDVGGSGVDLSGQQNVEFVDGSGVEFVNPFEELIDDFGDEIINYGELELHEGENEMPTIDDEFLSMDIFEHPTPPTERQPLPELATPAPLDTPTRQPVPPSPRATTTKSSVGRAEADWWDPALTHIPTEFPDIEGTPVLECARILWDYLNTRAGRVPCIAERRLAQVRQVYWFLFGVGFPQCIAAQLPPEAVVTPDPALIDSYVSNIKKGRYLKRLCQFQKRYQDDNAEVPDWQSLAVEITEVMMDLPLAGPFLEEVDAEEAPQYGHVIKEPMWLKLVHQKLLSHQYRSFEDWKNDLFLIFRNCRTFNTPDSIIFRDCESLQNVSYSLLQPAEKLLGRKQKPPAGGAS